MCIRDREIGDFLLDKDVFFHVDATQSFGKLVDELRSLKYDMLSMSAHKLGGPQGIGALILRKKRYKLPPVKNIMYGGPQEDVYKRQFQILIPLDFIFQRRHLCVIVDDAPLLFRQRCNVIQHMFHLSNQLNMVVHHPENDGFQLVLAECMRRTALARFVGGTDQIMICLLYTSKSPFGVPLISADPADGNLLDAFLNLFQPESEVFLCAFAGSCCRIQAVICIHQQTELLKQVVLHDALQVGLNEPFTHRAGGFSVGYRLETGVVNHTGVFLPLHRCV